VHYLRRDRRAEKGRIKEGKGKTMYYFLKKEQKTFVSRAARKRDASDAK
jgi:hypothetical protein